MSEKTEFPTFDTDPRLALPLTKQLDILADLACDQNPGRKFTRCVPVDPKDHDIVIMSVVKKFKYVLDLVGRIDGQIPHSVQQDDLLEDLEEFVRLYV